MSLTIGIDVGGTKVLGGVVDEAGKVLTTARKDTPRQGGSALTQTIADVAKELLAQHSVASVGVSAAATHRNFRFGNWRIDRGQCASEGLAE